MIGYLRVSTQEQARDGYSMDVQRRDIQLEADARGWAVEWVQDPGYSAKNIRRPGLTYSLERLAAGTAPGLVVAHLDRLSRSLLDFCELVTRAEREGWQLVCLNPRLDLTSPGGRMVAHVMAAFAQFERELIGARVKEGMAEARRQGRRLGGPRLIPADVQARIRREHAGGSSLRSIARKLNDDGVPTVRGELWHASTVRAVVTR